ncbi:MAG: hypothetical protein HYX32_07155 [Actinobacteria bacterium]|nr:hypothetical protein [Actinomycetota bacterium]
MVAIRDEIIDDLERQSEIAIAFEVTTVLELEPCYGSVAFRGNRHSVPPGSGG